MRPNDFPQEFLFAIFAVFFLLLWIMMAAVLASFGWSRLAQEQNFSQVIPPDARRFLWKSIAIKDWAPIPMNYGSCVNFWVARQGFYMRPSLPFRPFHPLLYFPWSSIKGIIPRKKFFMTSYEVSHTSNLPIILLSGLIGRTIYNEWRTYAQSSATTEVS